MRLHNGDTPLLRLAFLPHSLFICIIVGENDADNESCDADRNLHERLLVRRRVEDVIGGGASKPERIEKVLASSLGKTSKSDIVLECPDISLTTIERTLHDLLEQGKIEKVGTGRSTGYVWKG